jgi:hypothetical protein
MAAMPKAIDTMINGRAIFISRRTPDKEVKVLDPVKFMARNEERAGKRKT